MVELICSNARKKIKLYLRQIRKHSILAFNNRIKQNKKNIVQAANSLFSLGKTKRNENKKETTFVTRQASISIKLQFQWRDASALLSSATDIIANHTKKHKT